MRIDEMIESYGILFVLALTLRSESENINFYRLLIVFAWCCNYYLRNYNYCNDTIVSGQSEFVGLAVKKYEKPITGDIILRRSSNKTSDSDDSLLSQYDILTESSHVKFVGRLKYGNLHSRGLFYDDNDNLTRVSYFKKGVCINHVDVHPFDEAIFEKQIDDAVKGVDFVNADDLLFSPIINKILLKKCHNIFRYKPHEKNFLLRYFDNDYKKDLIKYYGHLTNRKGMHEHSKVNFEGFSHVKALYLSLRVLLAIYIGLIKEFTPIVLQLFASRIDESKFKMLILNEMITLLKSLEIANYFPLEHQIAQTIVSANRQAGINPVFKDEVTTDNSEAKVTFWSKELKLASENNFGKAKDVKLGYLSEVIFNRVKVMSVGSEIVIPTGYRPILLPYASKNIFHKLLANKFPYAVVSESGHAIYVSIYKQSQSMVKIYIDNLGAISNANWQGSSVSGNYNGSQINGRHKYYPVYFQAALDDKLKRYIDDIIISHYIYDDEVASNLIYNSKLFTQSWNYLPIPESICSLIFPCYPVRYSSTAHMTQISGNCATYNLSIGTYRRFGEEAFLLLRKCRISLLGKALFSTEKDFDNDLTVQDEAHRLGLLS